MKKYVTARLTVVIGAVALVSMTLLFLVVNHHITKVLQEKAVADMNVIAGDRAELVETYIQGCCNFVDAYSRTSEATDALLHPKDDNAIRSAREITKSIAGNREGLEGLYIAQWDTYVLAHINPDSVDKTFREPDSAAELEAQIRKADAAFCTGIVQAPVTKKMVIPIYAPVKDDAGEMIGFAGGAFLTDDLSGRLAGIGKGSKTDVSYSLINAKTGTYIFSDDEAKVGTECMDDDVLDAILEVRRDASLAGDCNFTKGNRVVSCHYMANRDWVFVVEDESTEVFSVVSWVRIVLLASCLVVTALMILVVLISIHGVMRPLRSINRAIGRLQEGDYSQGHAIEKYTGRSDEFGQVAQAVCELNGVMENQYELFLEMLKVQTVGMIVMRSLDRKIVLINDRAKEMMNLGHKEGDVTHLDIRNEFDDDNLAVVDSYIDKLMETEDGEVSYEVTITNGAIRRRIYTNAKHVVLANGDDDVILCMTDLTELEQRKKIRLS